MKLTISITLRETLFLYFEEKNGWRKFSQYVNDKLEKALIKTINFDNTEFNLSAGLNVNKSIIVEVNVYKAFMFKYGKGKVSKYINSCINQDIEDEQKETGKETTQKTTKTETKAEAKKPKNSIKAKTKPEAKKENNLNRSGKNKGIKDKWKVKQPLQEQKKVSKRVR